MFRQNFLKFDEADPEGGNGGGGAKTVSYESHQKLLGEKKTIEKQLKELSGKLESLESAELEKKGELSKAVEMWKNKYNELSQKNVGLLKTVSERAIRAQFNVEASKLGCQDVELAFKACDFSDIDLNENLEFDSAKLVPKLQELAKSKSYLFKKDVKVPANPQLKNGGDGGTEDKSKKISSEMSHEDLVKVLANPQAYTN